MKNAILTLTAIAVLAVGACAQNAAPPVAQVPAPQAGPATLNPDPCVLVALRSLHPRMVDSLATWLKLTSDQKIKVADLLTKAEADLQPAVKAQRKAAEDFVALMVKSTPSEHELTAAAAIAESAEQVMLIAKVRTLVALRALLTAEQNEAMSKWLDRWSAAWKPMTQMPQPLAPLTPPAGPTPRK